MPAASLVMDRPAASALMVDWQAQAAYSRGDLVELARSGFRGLRITEPVTVGRDGQGTSAQFVKLLVDAAGVGLRVRWHGEYLGPPGYLGHVDPPRGSDGKPAWPVARTPLLVIRHGPGFVEIDDLRGPRPARGIVTDQDVISALRRYAEPSRPLDADRPLLDRLVKDRLVLRLGEICVALPVRFKYARL